jgi:predicted outer membrane repeat protein
MRLIRITTLLLLVASLARSATAGETYYVPDDFATIQEAIDAAAAGDIIMVRPGVYFGPIDINENVKIISTDGADVTAIDGSKTSDSIVSIIHRNRFTLLDGFSIQNADGGTPVGQDETIIVGGGVRVLGGLPSIENCRFIDCHSGYGGGIHCDGTVTNVRNCIFTGCSASANAGALLAINGSVTISDCVFDGNSATLDGGALHIVKGSSSLTNCVITNNYSIFGGGFYWHSQPGGDPLPVTGCTISMNVAKNKGGGIRGIPGRPPVIFNSTFLCDNEPDEIYAAYIDELDNTLCVCPADIDGNGDVETNDILVIVAQWNSTTGLGDVNFDGITNITDLLMAIQSFGPCEDI